MDRKELRRKVIAERIALSEQDYCAKSAQICSVIAAHAAWHKAKAVLFYLPFRNEVDIEPLMHVAWQQHKKVLVPRCIKEDFFLQVVPLNSLAELEAGAYGIREPQASIPEGDPRDLDLILIPGSVFDRYGGRMGYGAGYYDRFLLRCRSDAVRLAPLFDLQLTDRLELEPHDQKMNLLISESMTLSIK